MASTALATVELPEGALKRGISEPQWTTLAKSLYPGANPLSILMVIDYCAARKLDPLKKPCHIVPMEVKDARTNVREWRDVVMPGIYEYRTTAQRTGDYLGHSKPEYGPLTPYMGVEAPEWCEMTAYRWNHHAGQRVEFPVRVYFREVVAIARDRQTNEWKANARWTKAPIQMLTKCAEAAALREAFPDEFGGEQTAEEMDGQRAVDTVIDVKPVPVSPEGYDDWLMDMALTAENGTAALQSAWKDSKPELRRYLTTNSPDRWDALKAKAELVDVGGADVEPPL